MQTLPPEEGHCSGFHQGIHQGKAEPRVPDLVVDMGASTEVWQGPPPRTHVAATNRLGEKGLCHEADWERRTSQADLV